jgi:hypothetical protein
MKLEFEYEIKEKVGIKDLELFGVVVGYYYGETGKQYQVSYFKDGDKKVTYLYPEEIEKLTKQESMGFKT